MQTDLAAFDTTPDEPFDAVVCNMVLLSIPDWQAAMAAYVKALRPGGRFVFSVHHPAFEELLGTWREFGHYQLDRYFDEYPIHGLHATDYHRSLSAYVNEFVRLGCQVEELVEPHLDAATGQTSGIPGIESYVQLPNFLIVARCRTRCGGNLARRPCRQDHRAKANSRVKSSVDSRCREHRGRRHSVRCRRGSPADRHPVRCRWASARTESRT